MFRKQNILVSIMTFHVFLQLFVNVLRLLPFNFSFDMLLGLNFLGSVFLKFHSFKVTFFFFFWLRDTFHVIITFICLTKTKSTARAFQFVFLGIIVLNLFLN